MKSSLSTTILSWVLATSLVLSIFFLVKFFFSTRQLRALQPEVQAEMIRYQNSHATLNLLVNELAEYGKRNPDFNRILESAITKPGPAPATKPAGK